MYNPKDILTEAGYREFQAHIFNMQNALFFVLNHADDLHIGALDSEQLDVLHKMSVMVEGNNPVMLTGDGETMED